MEPRANGSKSYHSPSDHGSMPILCHFSGILFSGAAALCPRAACGVGVCVSCVETRQRRRGIEAWLEGPGPPARHQIGAHQTYFAIMCDKKKTQLVFGSSCSIFSHQS
jgi:hypothetical protein